MVQSGIGDAKDETRTTGVKWLTSDVRDRGLADVVYARYCAARADVSRETRWKSEERERERETETERQRDRETHG